jgi:hypothetical protein
VAAEPATVRGRPHGRIGYVFPTVVVRESSEYVALFQPRGTICKSMGGPRGGPGGRYLLEWDGTHHDVVFELETIHVHVPGDPFWVIRRWESAAYVGWYINLAAPWTRTSIGFDTEDHKLDITVADDMSAWRWKDEDGLAWMVDRGRYSPEQAATIRANGLVAVERMERREPPFHGDWSELKPDPSWGVPELAHAWDDVATR